MFVLFLENNILGSKICSVGTIKVFGREFHGYLIQYASRCMVLPNFSG